MLHHSSAGLETKVVKPEFSKVASTLGMCITKVTKLHHKISKEAERIVLKFAEDMVVSENVAGREDPDAELRTRLDLFTKKHKARTKDAAEPDIKNLNYEKQSKTKQDKTMKKQDYGTMIKSHEAKT